MAGETLSLEEFLLREQSMQQRPTADVGYGLGAGTGIEAEALTGTEAEALLAPPLEPSGPLVGPDGSPLATWAGDVSGYQQPDPMQYSIASGVPYGVRPAPPLPQVSNEGVMPSRDRLSLKEFFAHDQAIWRRASQQMQRPPEESTAPPYREYIPQAPSDYVAARLARRGQQVATGLGEAAKFVLGGKLAVAQIPEPPTPRPPNIAEQTIERGLKWLEEDIEYKYPYSRKAIEAGQRPDFWKSPAFLAEQGVDTILQFAQMIGTSAAAGPGAAIGMVGTEAFGSGKRASKKRLLERGYSEQDADRISDTVGIASASVEGITSLFPLKLFHMKPGASSKVWTSVAGRLVQGVGVAKAESGQEMTAEFGQAASQRILEDDPSAFDGLGLRLAQAGFLGLLGGGGAASPAMVINAITDVANLDNVRAEKFAEEVARLSADDTSRQKLEALSKKENPSRSDMRAAGIRTPMNAEQREGARQSLVEMLGPVQVSVDDSGRAVALTGSEIEKMVLADPNGAINYIESLTGREISNLSGYDRSVIKRSYETTGRTPSKHVIQGLFARPGEGPETGLVIPVDDLVEWQQGAEAEKKPARRRKLPRRPRRADFELVVRDIESRSSKEIAKLQLSPKQRSDIQRAYDAVGRKPSWHVVQGMAMGAQEAAKRAVTATKSVKEESPPPKPPRAMIGRTIRRGSAEAKTAAEKPPETRPASFAERVEEGLKSAREEAAEIPAEEAPSVAHQVGDQILKPVMLGFKYRVSSRGGKFETGVNNINTARSLADKEPNSYIVGKDGRVIEIGGTIEPIAASATTVISEGTGESEATDEIGPEKEAAQLSEVEPSTAEGESEGVAQKPSEETLPPRGTRERRLTGPARVVKSETGAADPMAVVKIGTGGIRRIGQALGETWLAKKTREKIWGLEPSEFGEARNRRNARVRAVIWRAKINAADLRRAAKKAFGTKKLTEQQLSDINDVLHKRKPPETIPEPLREPVNVMRAHRISLSRAFIQEGLAQGDLAAKIEQDMEVYWHRSFQAFDDVHWERDLPDDIRKLAREWLKGKYPKRSDDQIENLINSILAWARRAGGLEPGEGNPFSFVSGSKNSKDLSVLFKRGKLEAPLRALLGEYQDPFANYMKTIAKMAQLLETHKFLSEVRDIGIKGGYFFYRGDPNIPKDADTPIAADKTKVLSPLNGIRTYPEIAKAFAEAGKADTMSWFSFAVFAARKAQTVESLSTHVVNTLGNVSFFIGQGHYDIREIGPALHAIAVALTGRGGEGMRKYVEMMRASRIIGSDVQQGELKVAMEKVIGSDLESLLGDRGLVAGFKAMNRLAMEAYGMQDAIAKIMHYELEKRAYRKMYPEWGETKLHNKAVELALRTTPTYDFVPKGVKKFGRSIWGGDYINFRFESFRILGATIRIAAGELSDPVTRMRGARRLAGLSMVTGVATQSLASLFKMIFGISDDEDAAMRWFVAPWNRFGHWIHLGRDKNNDPEFIDTSRADPFSAQKHVVNAFLSGKDWEESLRNSALETFEPFLGPNMASQAVLDVVMNEKSWSGVVNRFHTRKSRGPQLYNPQSPTPDKLLAIGGRLLEPVTPGTIKSAVRTTKSMLGDDRYTAKGELSALVGFRISKVDVKKSLGFRASAFKDSNRNATILLTGPLKKGSDADVLKGWKDMNSARGRLYEEMSEAYEAAVAIHPDKIDEIERVMRRGGHGQAVLSEESIQHIKDGTVPVYYPSNVQLLKRLIDVLPKGEDRDGAQEALDKKIGSIAQAAGAEIKRGITEKVKERNKEIEEAGKALKAIGVTEAQALKSLEVYWLKRDKGGAETPGDAARIRRPKSSRSRTETKRRLHQLYRGVAITQQPAQ